MAQRQGPAHIVDVIVPLISRDFVACFFPRNEHLPASSAFSACPTRTFPYVIFGFVRIPPMPPSPNRICLTNKQPTYRSPPCRIDFFSANSRSWLLDDGDQKNIVPLLLRFEPTISFQTRVDVLYMFDQRDEATRHKKTAVHPRMHAKQSPAHLHTHFLFWTSRGVGGI